MKKWLACFIFMACWGCGVVNADSQCANQVDCLRKLLDYLGNLTADLGYKPAESPSAINSELSVYKALLANEQSSVNLYLGSIIPPIYATKDTGAAKFDLIPSSIEGASLINEKVATALLYSNDQGKVESKLQTTDEVTAIPQQADPMMQILLNTLSIPPAVCIKFKPKVGGVVTCEDPELNAASFAEQNANLPDLFGSFYKNEENDNPQMVATILNSNSLITPFVVTDGPPPTANDAQDTTATADVTAQQVSTFIQYAAGSMLPLDLPTLTLLTGQSAKTKLFRQAAANYYLSLRTYVARLSVGLSNLYSILAKRLPQNSADGKVTSQALIEYQMATWRLFDTSSKDSQQKWLEFINSASPASVQKEMAVLLAEINYQLYLNRQQQERLLMTNSALLFIGLADVVPKTEELRKAAGVAGP
ncbi:MAG: hypothetical protein A3F18_00735 [Legionellales bacterium RIFCSPHIGHO2_12_FULL_37_14]|nr:MAG: hypothetical protein A3F18_00735 [Legionellales bacterium RIFCSPHIGHO2_12_FULL_37_14]